MNSEQNSRPSDDRRKQLSRRRGEHIIKAQRSARIALVWSGLAVVLSAIALIVSLHA